MKIRQCFLKLQLKMSGMFSETHCTICHAGKWLCTCSYSNQWHDSHAGQPQPGLARRLPDTDGAKVLPTSDPLRWWWWWWWRWWWWWWYYCVCGGDADSMLLLRVKFVAGFFSLDSGVARICCEEGQSCKLGHGALTVNCRAGYSSWSMTDCFVANAVLIERAVSCCHLHQLISQTTQYLDNWLSDLLQSELKWNCWKPRGHVPHKWRRYCLWKQAQSTWMKLWRNLHNGLNSRYNIFAQLHGWANSIVD